jgi:hypothetical protein
MRTGLLTAVAIAAVAFSGVAQASVITETFTGFINSGSDNMGAFGSPPAICGDDGCTGGANLAGDTITFSFSYDIGLLEADGTWKGQYSSFPGGEEYVDHNADSAITGSVTINSQTVTIANNGPYAYLVGDYGQFNIFAQNGQTPWSSIDISLNTTQNYSTGDVNSQTELDALFEGGVTTGTISISDGNDSPSDDLAISNVSAESSATPEPTTWISLALGCGMVGLLKRQRGRMTAR